MHLPKENPPQGREKEKAERRVRVVNGHSSRKAMQLKEPLQLLQFAFDVDKADTTVISARTLVPSLLHQLDLSRLIRK